MERGKMEHICAFCGGKTETVRVIDEDGKEITFCDWICLRSYVLLKTKRYH